MEPGYRELLVRFCRAEPVCSHKSARDLTQAEARDMVAHFIATDQVKLDRQIAFNESGQLTYPKAGEKVYLQPPVIAGVPFVIVNPKTGLPSAMLHRVGGLNLIFVVLLQRLAAMLKRDWGATQIYYGGFGAGGGQCHIDGRAIDFYGALTGSHGQFMVKRDWGDAPIRLADGSEVFKWPADVPVKYRLDTGSNMVARAFFKDVWDLATQEARPGGYICHPDHPTPHLRKEHQNHMHFQIGTT